ncbi:MAG: hypothetical protein WCD25_24865, partial [Pseudolabrys sp.]
VDNLLLLFEDFALDTDRRELPRAMSLGLPIKPMSALGHKRITPSLSRATRMPTQNMAADTNISAALS